MKRESLWMLLVTRIPREEEKQQEILAAFEEAFREDRRSEYLTLLRASFMCPRDMEARADFFRKLGDRLMEHLKNRPELASGPHGLYIGFIAEDLAKMADPGLAQVGRSLSMALRLATNPPAIRFTAEGTISLPACPVPVGEASVNPEAWVALLIRQTGLWTNPQLAPIRDQLAACPAATAPGDLRRRAHALLVVGAHLENAGIPGWPHGCYLAATATDPTYDLPWAFLALIDPDPHSGLAAAHQALVANPKSLPGFVNRGTVLGRLGRSEEALRDFAEAARYDQDNPRLLLQCAHAALESGAIETAVQVFLSIHRAFPGVPEAWYGLARLFWRAGLTDMAKRCQEKFTGLRHGNVPRELRLVGRLRVESRRGGVRVQVDQETGVTPWELGEVLTGEHRIAWENGPVRKVMVDEGESIRVAWCEGKEDVEVLEYTPEPTSWKQTQPDGTVSWVTARVVLAPYLVDDIDQMPIPGPLPGILARVPRPISPFPTEMRLTVEGVFRILLEEILADGILDRTEGELLRAVRDRLLIDPARFEAILGETRQRAACQVAPQAGPVDTEALYRRLYAKALEDKVLEPSERRLLETVAEALLLMPDEVAKIEASFRSGV